jgi:hypothetical protein
MKKCLLLFLAFAIAGFIFSGCDVSAGNGNPTPENPGVTPSPSPSVSPIIGGTELIDNGDFSNDVTSWGWWTGEAGDATWSVVSGEAQIVIANAGNQDWSIQFNNKGVGPDGFDVTTGSKYVLTFNIRSSVARKVRVELGRNYDPWGAIWLNETLTLAASGTMSHYEFPFTAAATDTNGRINFCLGKNDPSPAGTIYIDSVSLIKIPDATATPTNTPTETPTQDPNSTPTDTPLPTATPVPTPIPLPVEKVTNGTFDGNLSGWSSWFNASATGSVSYTDGEAKIEIINDGGATVDSRWFIQFNQAGISVFQGKTYTLTFDAYASADRDIQVLVERNGGDYFKWFNQITSVTTVKQTFSYTFMAAGSPDIADNHVNFCLAPGSGTTVYIDNVSLMEQ